MTAIEAHASMEAIVLERIAELLRYRSWWRTNRWADWPEIRTNHEIELRALVRLARQYRKATHDPYPVTMTFEAWTNGALVEVGR